MSKTNLPMAVCLGLGFLSLVSACGTVSSANADGAAGTGGAGGAGTAGNNGAGGVDASAAAGSGSAGSGGAGGTGGVTAVCNASQPFGAPVLVAGLSQDGTNDGDARLTADELTIFFWSDRSTSGQIFSATRTSRTSPFGTPQQVTAVSSSGGSFPSVTGDGLTIYLESDSLGTSQVFVASRTAPGAQFSTPTPVTIATFMSGDGKSYVLPDESAIYFVSYRTGPGAGDIYRSGRVAGSQFGTPVLVPTINGSSSDYDPVSTGDELTIYFASDRADPAAKGDFDIWMAKRASLNAPFDPPVDLQEVNSSVIEEPSWISPDNCRLYLYRQGANGYKIYVASRSP